MLDDFTSQMLGSIYRATWSYRGQSFRADFVHPIASKEKIGADILSTGPARCEEIIRLDELSS